MTETRLMEISGKFSGLSVGIVGDFFLDKYLEVDSSIAEKSVETGKTANQVTKIRYSPGAAGNVVNNLSALGAGKLFAIGFTGDDGESYDLNKYLADIGCNTKYLFKDTERMTPTYLKPRDYGVKGLGGEHNRYDTKNRTETSPDAERKIIENIEHCLPSIDALIIVDQIEKKNCGVITENVRNLLSGLALNNQGKIFFADSRSRIGLFRNIIIKPNQYEVMGIDNPAAYDEIETNVLLKTVFEVRKKINAPVFVTCGSRGIIVSDPSPELIPGVKISGPADPTGAGDSVSAGIVLSLASGASFPEAALIGNLTASVTVEQLDTCGTCSKSQLITRYKSSLKH